MISHIATDAEHTISSMGFEDGDFFSKCGNDTVFADSDDIAMVDRDSLSGDGLFVFETCDTDLSASESGAFAQMRDDVHRVLVLFFETNIPDTPLVRPPHLAQLLIDEKILGVFFEREEHYEYWSTISTGQWSEPITSWR